MLPSKYSFFRQIIWSQISEFHFRRYGGEKYDTQIRKARNMTEEWFCETLRPFSFNPQDVSFEHSSASSQWTPFPMKPVKQEQ